MATSRIPNPSTSWLRGAVAPVLLWGIMGVPAGVGAQAAVDTVGMRAGSAQIHPVIGIMGGRLEVHRGPGLDVLGARAGLGFGDLVRFTGYYWRTVDTDAREFLDGRGWGGEAQLNLSAGFGLTPFVTAGFARISADTLEDRNAVVLGGGLMIPLGPVNLSVAAQDHVLGLSGLDDADETVEVTHNWLFSAGVSVALGRTRAREPVTVARAVRPGTVDTVWLDARGELLPPDTVWLDARGEPLERGVRNYQSDRHIEVPIPLEGSITLRYGPEAAARAGAPPAPATEAGVPAVGVGQAPTAATPGAVQPQVAPGLSEAAIQQIIDGTVAALLPRLEARDVERQNRLRADLNAALTAQREVVRQVVQQEVTRLGAEPGATVLPEGPPAAPAATAAGLEAEIRAAADRLAAARAELARIEAARGDPAEETEPPAPAEPRAPADPMSPIEPGMAVTDLRAGLVDLAARHPALTAAELERGPALVVADVAFEGGSALLDERARAALTAVADLLRAAPGRNVFVQGHADAAVPEVQGQQLSELRAEVVRSLLVQAGVEPGRVHALGFGAGRPVATNETAAGRALNRRVEIVIGETEVNGGRR